MHQNSKQELLMSWEIKLDADYVDYVCCEKNHLTQHISRVDRKRYSEPSSGYQEPDDDVMEDTYRADSDHGVFEWVVIARRTGFNAYADIYDVSQIKVPEKCEVSMPPAFSIRES